MSAELILPSSQLTLHICCKTRSHSWPGANTGLWLVESDHVTQILASDWSKVITTDFIANHLGVGWLVTLSISSEMPHLGPRRYSRSDWADDDPNDQCEPDSQLRSSSGSDQSEVFLSQRDWTLLKDVSCSQWLRLYFCLTCFGYHQPFPHPGMEFIIDFLSIPVG